MSRIYNYICHDNYYVRRRRGVVDSYVQATVTAVRSHVLPAVVLSYANAISCSFLLVSRRRLKPFDHSLFTYFSKKTMFTLLRNLVLLSRFSASEVTTSWRYTNLCIIIISSTTIIITVVVFLFSFIFTPGINYPGIKN